MLFKRVLTFEAFVRRTPWIYEVQTQTVNIYVLC